MNQASHLVQKHGINFNLNIDIKKIMLENSNREREEEQPRLTKTQDAQPRNIEENTISDADGEVVNPNKYFSE
jgi:hypothetical protein